eukprot:g13267.t1
MLSSGAILELATLLGAAAAVRGQYIYGGEVPVTCTDCICEGTTDEGDVTVFDNPSTANRVVSVDGEYSEIAETSCGTSVFAVGSTMYELHDVTLAPREFGEFEVISMMADDGSCSFTRTDDAPDCYSGASEVKELHDGISLTFDVCYCTDTPDFGGFYSYYYTYYVDGTSDSSSETELCNEAGFAILTARMTVDGRNYLYDFELVGPENASSGDLSVAPAPEEFNCEDTTRNSPPVEDATDPPIEEATDPPIEEATDPPIEEATDPPIEEATDPPIEEATSPPAQEAAEPPIGEATDPPARTAAPVVGAKQNTSDWNSVLPLTFEEVVIDHEGYAVPVSLTIDQVEIECEVATTDDGIVACFAEIGDGSLSSCIDVFLDEQRCLEEEDSLGLGKYVYFYGSKPSEFGEVRAMGLREFPDRDPLSRIYDPIHRILLGNNISYVSSSVQVSPSNYEVEVECAAFEEQAQFLVGEDDTFFFDGFETYTRNISCTLGELPSCDSRCTIEWRGSESFETQVTKRVWREGSGLCVTGINYDSAQAYHYLPDFLWGGGETPCVTTILEDVTSLSDTGEVVDMLSVASALATIVAAAVIGALVYCFKALPPGALWIVVVGCDVSECVALVSLWIAAGRCRMDLYCPESLILPTRIVAAGDFFSVILELAAAVLSISLGTGSKRPMETVQSCVPGSTEEIATATVSSFVASGFVTTAGLVTVAIEFGGFGSVVGWPLALRVVAVAFELL